MILDETGKKLSKRSGTSTSFRDYIEQGYLPDAVLNFLATMGWSSGEDKKLFPREELIEKFTPEGIANHPAIFDLPKLNDLNGEYIRMMSIEQLADLILPRLQCAGYVSDSPTGEEREHLLAITALIQERMVVLGEAPDRVSFFYSDDFEYEEKGVSKSFRKETAPALLKGLIGDLSRVEKWDVASIESAVRGAADNLELGHGKAIHAARLAVTGRTWGPGLFELMKVIGKDRCVARLERAAEWVARQQ